ncbi:MAG: AraC family transcriptional regulator [Azospira oryzae]|jgi:AraC-like DNA-binding protein|nr:MAG: AraC family transcriptional regulator [Azospira oryzae]
MVFQDFLPSPALREYVSIFRLVHFTFGAADSIPFKPYPPRAEQYLAFYPRDTEAVHYPGRHEKIANTRSALVGQHDVVTDRYIGKDFLVFQVVFQAGALFRLTGVPAHELNNTYMDAEAIFGNSIKEVNARLTSTDRYEEMTVLIENFLLQQIRRSKMERHAIDGVAHQIVKTNSLTSLDALANTACLSSRQFERKFMERMGVTPKYFSRIARFAEAYRIKNSYPDKDWLSIALQCGYYDYQHLAKDYKQFTSQTPLAFHLLDLKAPERTFGERDRF